MTTTATKSISSADGIRSASAATRSDEQLLLDYRSSGDADLFATLVHRYERELYSYLQRYLSDAALAEDVFQATFLQVHLKCEQFREDLAVRPWVYRIATNQAIDALRRNRRHRVASLDQHQGAGGRQHTPIRESLEGADPVPSHRLQQQESRTRVRQAVRQLPEPFRQIVTLVYLNGLKYREAAEVLSIPLGTLKSRMHTALKMLGQMPAAADLALTS